MVEWTHSVSPVCLNPTIVGLPSWLRKASEFTARFYSHQILAQLARSVPHAVALWKSGRTEPDPHVYRPLLPSTLEQMSNKLGLAQAIEHALEVFGRPSWALLGLEVL